MPARKSEENNCYDVQYWLSIYCLLYTLYVLFTQFVLSFINTFVLHNLKLPPLADKIDQHNLLSWQILPNTFGTHRIAGVLRFTTTTILAIWILPFAISMLFDVHLTCINSFTKKMLNFLHQAERQENLTSCLKYRIQLAKNSFACNTALSNQFFLFLAALFRRSQ